MGDKEVCWKCEEEFKPTGVNFLRVLCGSCADKMWKTQEYKALEDKNNAADEDCYDAVTAWCKRTKEKAHRPVKNRHTYVVMAEMLGLEKNDITLIPTPHSNSMLFNFQKEPLKAACEKYLDDPWMDDSESEESPALAYLKSIEWNMGCGGDKNEGQCNECDGLSPDWTDDGWSEVAGHKRDCKLAAAIPGALYVEEKPEMILLNGRTVTIKDYNPKTKTAHFVGGGFVQFNKDYVPPAGTGTVEVNIVNVNDPDKALSALNSDEEKKAILKVLNRNGEVNKVGLRFCPEKGTPLKCTCGVESLGVGKHSSWCDTERT